MVRLFALQSADGSHNRWITQGEADRMVENGEASRLGGRKNPQRKYRRIALPEPSESHESPSCLTLGDMRAMAGVQAVDEIRIERLIGYGMLREGTLVPVGHFL